MTVNQIAALKYLIITAKSGNDLSKRIMLFLIDQSRRLTTEVCLSVIEGRDGYDYLDVREASHLDSLTSANGHAHINEVLAAMGSDLFFSLHYGDFDPRRDGDPFCSDGQFAGVPPEIVYGVEKYPGLIKEDMPVRYTFWLSKKHYSRQAKYVQISSPDLDMIELKKPRLEYGE